MPIQNLFCPKIYYTMLLFLSSLPEGNVGELRQTLKAWSHLSTPKTLFLRVLYHQVLVEATKFSSCTINFDKEMQSNFATPKQNFYIHIRGFTKFGIKVL